MKKVLMFLTVLLAAPSVSMAQDLQLNDREYFERQGVNVLVFSNSFNGGFNDEKNSGIEIIHHGVRTVQGGAVRLNNTPEQWDLVPRMTDRKVDRENGSIEVAMRYEKEALGGADAGFTEDFDSRVIVTAKGKAVEIAVWLDKPVPEKLAGEAGFNIEFLPSQYWLKTFTMDGRLGRLPRYATSQTITRPNSEKPRQFKGFKTYDDRGTGRFIDPLPIETGHSIVMATDDPGRMVKITSDAELKLFDGRMLAQNGWFVLRSVLPKGKTGKVITWTVEPNAIPGWIREPNIGFSQIGYTPEQPKVAVIELDKLDTPQTVAKLMRINADGTTTQAFEGAVTSWGPYFKYNYVKFDFSAVKEPGVYFIQYGKTKTNDFLIDAHVYDKITDATTDVWVPIHMNHMYVTEGYRTWHGEPFKEGYLQAPESDHFDLHRQGATTDTKYKPLELIPGLNVGGFFDAGDFDIETGSNINVVQNFIRTWELFRPQRDETFVSQKQRYVDLHRPDGVPDILQFIEHGTLNLVAQAENIGHMASTLSNSILDNYHHLGDAASITDGLHYDPSLKPYEVSADGKRSGTPDDMWAFTTRSPQLDLRAATMFAAASHALKGYNDDLAERALTQSKRLMKEATELIAQHNASRDDEFAWLDGTEQVNIANPRQQGAQPDKKRQKLLERSRKNREQLGDMATNLMLYSATQEKQYLDNFAAQIWDALELRLSGNMQTALDAVPYMDEAYKEKLRPYVVKYEEYIKSFDTQNPYGVPIGLGNWAGVNMVLNFGITVNYAHIYFPDIVGKDEVYRVANWLYGRHPYHNYSFVAVVGATRPKQVFYGNNRADFSFIPGNVAPGLLFRRPDHFENYDDWPFLWGQNEGTIAGNTQYIIFGSSLKNIVAE
ncbi:MAG: glycoside hydrolase family 9 protein [Prevotella sp.]|nr:glycoside hydrolase family 9 protein [Prevotella sp.]